MGLLVLCAIPIFTCFLPVATHPSQFAFPIPFLANSKLQPLENAVRAVSLASGWKAVMCPGVNDTALGCVWVDAMLHCVPAPAERTHTHTDVHTPDLCVCVLLNLPSNIYFYLPVLNRIHFLLKENDGEEQHCFGVGNDGPISQIL